MTTAELVKIANQQGIDSVSYEGAFSAICPLSQVLYSGRVRLEYQPDGFTFDLDSLYAWLESLEGQCLLLEDVCQRLFEDVKAAIGPKSITVFVRGLTMGGGQATVSKSGSWVG